MARASTVWVVLGGPDGPVPFTVKHEMLGWLTAHAHKPWIADLKIWRCQDGQYKDRPSARFSIADLTAKPQKS